MKRSVWVLTVLFAASLFVAGIVWAQAPGQGGMDPQGKQGQGMMQGKGMMKGHGMMQGQCPMMQGGQCPMGGKGMGGGMGQCGCVACAGLAGPFHQWVKNVMVHKEQLNLSDKQSQQIESILSDNMKSAIKTRGDIQSMRVDLAQAIRKDPTQTKTIRSMLDKIADRQVDLQMEVVEVYSRINKTLDENQRKKVEEMFGTPFSMPWEENAGDMAPMGHGGNQKGKPGK